MGCWISSVVLGCLLTIVTECGNPLVPNVGMADPHVHFFENKFYVYASHDWSANNTGFRMDDWWVWSSSDLVNWDLVSVLHPQDTPAPPDAYHECWATDAACTNTSCYFYVSLGPDQVAVVSGNSPMGPWKNVLGKPLLSADLGKQLGTTIRDPGVLKDGDDYYIVFGTMVYYICKLGSDLISLAETPKRLVVENALGPYGPGRTDDKPFLHKVNGVYYLSWGCFYGTSSSPYGPFQYQGSVIQTEYLAPDFRVPSNDSLPWYGQEDYADRHGSFWSAYGQDYYACNDRSHSTDPGPNRQYFRDTVIGYVNYFENSTIAPVVINKIGVGSYDAGDKIEAEHYFSIENGKKGHDNSGMFGVYGINSKTKIFYPKITNIPSNSMLKVNVSNGNSSPCIVRAQTSSGTLLASIKVPPTVGGWAKYVTLASKFPSVSLPLDLVFSFSGAGDEILRMESLSFA